MATLEEQVRDHLKSVEKRMEDQEKRYDGKIDELIKMIRDMKETNTTRSMEVPRDQSENSGANHNLRHENGSHNTGNPIPKPLGFTPKIEFPKFDGSGVRTWIKKAVKYFTLCKIVDDQKVDLASLYMIDKAEVWVSNYLSVRRHVEWSEFVIDLSARFKDDLTSNVVEKFNRLQQTSTIENYIDEFDNLRSLLEQSNHVLPDTYVLESFVGGLRPAVKPFVKAFNPVNVTDAIKYARLQEEVLMLNTQKLEKSYGSSTQKYEKTTPLSMTASNKSYASLANHPNATKPPLLPTPLSKPFASGVPKENARQPFKFIPAEVRADKIAKGLCYYCDQKYERGHKCAFRENQLFTVEIPSCDNEESEYEIDNSDTELELKEPLISVNALAGNQNYSTMRVQGRVKNVPLYVLVDSGSTHNFLDITKANDLGCKIEEVQEQAVIVADGNHITCKHIVKGFKWKFDGHEFKADVMLIALGSCDMVLGVQWLSTLGTVKWDFKELIMEFMVKDQVIRLCGSSRKKVKMVKGVPSLKFMK